MVNYKSLSAIFIAASLGTQPVFAAGLYPRQSPDDMNIDKPASDDSDNSSGGHQVYRFFNQTALVGYTPSPVPKGMNMSQDIFSRNLGTYRPGGFQAVIEQCLNQYSDRTKHCTTRYSHANEEGLEGYQSSRAILCCRDGYSIYLYNDRSRIDPRPDVRIDCFAAALIANETLSALLDPQTWRLGFAFSEEPEIINPRTKESLTHLTESYWSFDRTWSINTFYDSEAKCPIRDRYTWVEVGEWGADDNPNKLVSSVSIVMPPAPTMVRDTFRVMPSQTTMIRDTSRAMSSRATMTRDTSRAMPSQTTMTRDTSTA